MKTLFILLSIISIIWWVVAKLVNKYSYEAQHENLKLPDSIAFLSLASWCSSASCSSPSSPPRSVA